jgi:hypothetical protein
VEEFGGADEGGIRCIFHRVDVIHKKVPINVRGHFFLVQSYY